MAINWNRWKNQRSDNRDYSWQYGEEETDYKTIRQLAIAVLLFTLVYCAHISETVVAEMVDNGVGYMVNTPLDFPYLAEQVSPYLPASIDLSSWKKVQATVTKPADPLLYMVKPATGEVTASFGLYVHPVLKQEMLHEGIDIQAPVGAGVYAAAAGKVKLVADTAQRGKTIILEHGQDVDTLYGHLGEVLVSQGEVVSQGQMIGKIGKSGMAAVPMLYFEIREKGKAVDPMLRLKGNASSKEGK